MPEDYLSAGKHLHHYYGTGIVGEEVLFVETVNVDHSRVSPVTGCRTTLYLQHVSALLVG